MRDVTTELKELRLHGMVGAWTDLMVQSPSSMASSKWLIEHLLQAEHTDRAMRSVSHQMSAAKFRMRCSKPPSEFPPGDIEQQMKNRDRCRWRETSLMLELLSRAILPKLSLRDAQRNWPSIAYPLAEPTRKRISQNARLLNILS